jgi:AcrR family transcriptional regulator
MPSVTAARPARKPPSRYHHGDLRRALVQEAARTIGSSGVGSLTLRDVGRRLGVSRTALYRHFSDKSSLLAAVAKEGFQRFRRDLEQAWAGHEGTLRGLELMGVAYIRFAMTHSAHYRVMFGDFRELCDKDPELMTEAGAAFEVLVSALVSLQEAKLVRRDDPATLARFIWAIVHGVAMLAIDGQLGPQHAAPVELDALLNFALERMRTGIGVDNPETQKRRNART